MQNTNSVGYRKEEMQGKHDSDTRIFYTLNMDELIPKDHLLRRIDKVMSFEWVREETKPLYSHTGRPSIDPVVLIKMLLIGYLYDVRSERRLVEEVSLNLAYRWYLGFDLEDRVPNHSIFSKARKRFGKDLFVTIFDRVLSACIEVGLTGTGDEVIIDSPLVKANASLDSLVTIDLRPGEYWDSLDSYTDDEDGDTDDKDEVDRHKDDIHKDGHGAKTDSQEIVSAVADTDDVDLSGLATMGRSKKDKKPTSIKLSTTDPDASLHYRSGIGLTLSYKAHLAATPTGIVTATAVSASSEHDTTRLVELLDKHQAALGRPDSIAADSHYGSQQAYGFLQGLGIETYILPMKPQIKDGLFNKELFTYDQDNDHFTCPVGKTLKRKHKDHKKNLVLYKADRTDCSGCAKRDSCIDQKTRARSVQRYDSDFIEKARFWLDTDKGKEMMVKRKTVIEGINGQIKTYHGMDEANGRGTLSLEIQLALTTTAVNLKKLAKAIPDYLNRWLSNLRYSFFKSQLAVS